MNRINDISVDYKNGILEINGAKITTPVVVRIKGEDGWDAAKLFNPDPDAKKKREPCPTIVIDTRELDPDEAGSTAETEGVIQTDPADTENVKRNIDKTINAICDNIQDEAKMGPLSEDFPRKVESLAKLIFVRNFEYQQVFELDKEMLIHLVNEKISRGSSERR